MKMKFSIFLYLLPFSLSVPPSPYPLFIVHPYFPQVTPLPPLFIIRGYGIYIWNIPDLKTNEGESSYSSASSQTQNLEDDLLNQLSLNWPEPPELIQSPVLHQSKKTKVKLSTKEAYILLRVNEDNTCQLSYWMGNESTLAKRRITASFVIRLIHDFQMQIPGASLSYISREDQHRESLEFKMIFNLGTGYTPPTLYKLTGKTDDLIKEVPLDYNELNSIDTFVLDGTTYIKIWSASLNKRKRGIALILANYINTNDRLDITRNNNIQIGSELTGRDSFIFEKEFLFHLRNKESTSKFPVYIPDAPIEQVKKNRNLALFVYDIHRDYVRSREIFSRPVTLESFHPDKTYIVVDCRAFRIFIVVGSHGHVGILEAAMSDAEQHYNRLPESELRKITIIQNTYPGIGTIPIPTPFIIKFNVFKSFLNDAYNKMQT